MADFRYGFFCRPDNKNFEPQQEEKNTTSHIPDPKYKPAHYVDAGGRRLPTVVLPRPRYVTTTETYTEEFYLNSRDGFQYSHTKNSEPVKSYGLHHDKGIRHPSRPALNRPTEFNRLLVKVEMEEDQVKHEMRISKPMNDIEKAIEFFKEAVNLPYCKNNACPAPDHPKKDGYTKTIDSNEAARRFGNFGVPPPVPSANGATINCKEAARKYKGVTV